MRKVKMNKERELRSFPLQFRLNTEVGTTNETPRMLVEGVACVFNKETVMFEYDGIEYKEKIDPLAFDKADLSDVIFNYNHTGKVMARLRNNTLTLDINSDGLHVSADLSGTEAGRQLFEEIQGGYIDRMSMAFTVAEDAYDFESHTRTILRFKKIYDVSAVDIPAYDTTNISARDGFSVVYENLKALEQAAADEKRKTQLKIDIALAMARKD